MPDILHDFVIEAPSSRVFAGLSTPRGIDSWWTKESEGRPAKGENYRLWFGPEYDWRAVVSRCTPEREFELHITNAQRDWLNTRVGFLLEEKDGLTHLQFHHTGWPELNEHFRVSSFCWAMYLRLLKRFVEFGEVVPYERRLSV